MVVYLRLHIVYMGTERGVSEAKKTKGFRSKLWTHVDHDPIRLNRIMISSLCLSMIFSEKRFPLFRIML
jgi:hypothetical protein